MRVKTKKSHYGRPNISDTTLIHVLANTQATFEGVEIAPEHIANATTFVGAADEKFKRRSPQGLFARPRFPGQIMNILPRRFD